MVGRFAGYRVEIVVHETWQGVCQWVKGFGLTILAWELDISPCGHGQNIRNESALKAEVGLFCGQNEAESDYA